VSGAEGWAVREGRLRAESMEGFMTKAKMILSGRGLIQNPLVSGSGLDHDPVPYLLVEHLVRAGFLEKNDYDDEVRLTKAGAREVEKARSVGIKPTRLSRSTNCASKLARSGFPDTLLGTDWVPLFGAVRTS
jgi:hypothetical protein